MNIYTLKETKEYKSGDFDLVICPCCGHLTLNNNWICECGWEYDGKKEENEYSFANNMTPQEWRNEIYIHE